MEDAKQQKRLSNKWNWYKGNFEIIHKCLWRTPKLLDKLKCKFKVKIVEK